MYICMKASFCISGKVDDVPSFDSKCRHKIHAILLIDLSNCMWYYPLEIFIVFGVSPLHLHYFSYSNGGTLNINYISVEYFYCLWYIFSKFCGVKWRAGKKEKDAEVFLITWVFKSKYLSPGHPLLSCMSFYTRLAVPTLWLASCCSRALLSPRQDPEHVHLPPSHQTWDGSPGYDENIGRVICRGMGFTHLERSVTPPRPPHGP